MQVEQTVETFRATTRRWLAPLVAWIPDVTAFPRRRQAALAAAASILLHLLLLLGFVIGAFVWPEHKDVVPLSPPHPLEVTLVPRPAPSDPEPLVPRRTPILSRNGLNPAEQKPEHADFESDHDMAAASSQPATGLLPLPSQQGRTDLPGYDFATQDVRLGVVEEPPPETIRPAQPAEQKPQPRPPSVSPLYTPQPVAPEELAKAEKARPADQLPDPAKAARATPPPLKMSDKPGEETIAMLAATPKPKPAANPVPEPAPTAASASQPPAPDFVNRFQENLRKTAIEGNIARQGKDAFNSVSTPMGWWHRRLEMQIRSLCELKKRNIVGELGTVLVSIKLRPDGTVKSAKVIDDGGSPMHTELILEVLQQIRPEKLPADAEPLMEGGLLEIPLRFTLY